MKQYILKCKSCGKVFESIKPADACSGICDVNLAVFSPFAKSETRLTHMKPEKLNVSAYSASKDIYKTDTGIIISYLLVYHPVGQAVMVIILENGSVILSSNAHSSIQRAALESLNISEDRVMKGEALWVDS